MNKTKTITAYDSPVVKVVEIMAEGVLCSSIEHWLESDELLDEWE